MLAPFFREGVFAVKFYASHSVLPLGVDGRLSDGELPVVARDPDQIQNLQPLCPLPDLLALRAFDRLQGVWAAAAY